MPPQVSGPGGENALAPLGHRGHEQQVEVPIRVRVEAISRGVPEGKMLDRDADSAQMKVRPAWSGELPLPQLRVLVRRDEGVHAIVARVGEVADGHGALCAERLELRSACVRQLDEEGVLSRGENERDLGHRWGS
jgi:hypothetical protein